MSFLTKELDDPGHRSGEKKVREIKHLRVPEKLGFRENAGGLRTSKQHS